LKPELQRITSTTTKVRRLGYFVLFSKILNNTPLPSQSLQSRVIEEESQNRKYLEDACRELPIKRRGSESVTGEICSEGKTKGEDAFKRYLGTVIEFGLVHEIAGRLYNTKRGEVLSALSEKSINPFRLSFAQKYWFLKLILEKDYDYSRTALLCSIERETNEEQKFFSMLQELWRHRLITGNFKSPETYDELRKAINTKWTDQKRYYFENIKAPRLEWFSDLTVIDFWNINQNRVTVRDTVRLLLESEETNFSSLFVSHMKPSLKGSVTYWKEIVKKERDEWLRRFVLQSFDLFTSDVLPRISVNQIIEYSLSILAEFGVVCESNEFEDALERFVEGKSEKYRYVKTISEADRGYISKL
jgi:hypothetical protein